VATLLPSGDDEVDAVAATAREWLNIELDDWQRLFIQHLTTRSDGLLPDLVGLLVARQQGKTEAMKAYVLHRLMGGSRILSCAQSLTEAVDTWRETIGPIWDENMNGPLADQAKYISRSASSIGVELKNGGAWFVRAANKKAARGMDAIDLVWYDEARELHTWEAFNAINPTLTVAPEPQSVFTSNAGDLKSVVLNSFQKRGRKAAQLVGDDPIVWVEWSADPGLDFDDRLGWAQANPTLGTRTSWRSLENDLRTYREADDLNGWRTERLCQQVGAIGSALDVNAFRRLYDPDAAPPQPGDKGLWLSFTIDLNRRGAATLIGRQLADGRSQVGVLSHWDAPPGTEVSDRDVANQVVREYETWRPKGIAYNSFVAAGVAHLLTRRRLPLVDYKGRRYFDSCQMFAELIRTGMMTHDGDPILAGHVSVAVREDLRNGEGWFLSRRMSPGPIYCADGMAMLSHATSTRKVTGPRVVTLTA
jgi:hypothetical protein